MAPRDPHQVAATLPQDFLRHLWLLDIGHGNERNPDVLFDLRGHVPFPALLKGAGLDTGQGRLGGALGDGATDVEKIDAGLFQCRGDPAGGGEIVPLIPQELVGGDPHPEGKVLRCV